MITLYPPKGKKAETLSIMDRVKTFEDACEFLGIDEVQIGIKGLDQHSKSILAYAKLAIINEALNEGWKPDWTNSNQKKYVPNFINEPNSVENFSRYEIGTGFSEVTSEGSRLAYKSAELSEYASTQFIKEYNEFLSV